MLYLCLRFLRLNLIIIKALRLLHICQKGECTVFHGKKLANQTLVKQGEQIFIPEDVPHVQCNLSQEECVWIFVHSSGDDQDDLVRAEDCYYTLE